MIFKHAIRICCFLLAFTAKAEENLMFEKANQLYHNRNYDSAATLYLQMINDGYCAADLYYNAGNAFYRSNQTGMAVWSYKKALQIDNDKRTRDNLYLAEKRIKNPLKGNGEIFFLRWWKYLYSMLSLNSWALSSLFLFIAAVALLTFRRILGKKGIRPWLINTLLLLSLFCLVFTGVRYFNDTYHYNGIIVSEPASFIPVNQGEPVFLDAGTEVEFMTERKGRFLVRLPDGREGEIDPSVFRRL